MIRGLSIVYVETPCPHRLIAWHAACCRRWRQEELDHKQRDEEESEELMLRQQKALMEMEMLFPCRRAELERSVRK